MNVINHIAKVLVASMVLTAAVGCSQDEDATTVGPRGGVITSADGRFSVEIPAGALDQDIEITIEQVDCDVDDTDTLAECYEVGPVGLPLLFPAKVTYEVDDSMFELVSEEAIAVAVEKEEHWNLLADRKVEKGGHARVTASAVYLSAYALVATD